MNGPPPIDVSALPSFGFGRRDPMVWATALLITIEGTAFALVLFMFFYTRSRADLWPPLQVLGTSRALSALVLATLVVSAWPVHRTTKAAKREDIRGMRRGLSLATALAAGAIVLRWFELRALPFRWDANAYASLLWGALVLHSIHLVTGTLENALFLLLLYRGPVEKKHLVDVTANGLYWYFVIAAWLPFFTVFYLESFLP